MLITTLNFVFNAVNKYLVELCLYWANRVKLAVYLVGLSKTLLFSPHKAIDKSAYGDLARVGYRLLFNVYFDKYQNIQWI